MEYEQLRQELRSYTNLHELDMRKLDVEEAVMWGEIAAKNADADVLGISPHGPRGLPPR